MKELSIEEKAKAYDGLIERLKDLKFAYRFSPLSDTIEEKFPELAESEDERIKKSLIILLQHFCNGYRVPGLDFPVSYKDMLAWLEKQGNKDMGISEATKKKLEDSLNEALEKETPESWNEFLEKQGEQNLANSAKTCKDEPKFKIGDLITNGILVGKIDEIHEWGYHAYFGDHYADVPDVENWHKWTIQDAKDGDVLVASDGSIFLFKGTIDWGCKHYVALTTDGAVKFNKGLKHFWETSTAVHPATKEQRDLLFQKMHEAGYEWNAEKKELRKIEQKQVIDYPDSLPKDNWELVHEFVSKFGRVPKDEDELNVLVEYVLKRQKPAWSEEDEQYKSGLIGLVENSKAGLPINLRGKAADKCIYWLKSLKDRYTWKPSDKQMEALKGLLELINQKSMHGRELISLIEQLKKLKG